MEGLFSVLIFALMAFGGLAGVAWNRRRRVHAWTEAVRIAELTDVAENSSFWSTGGLTGRRGGLRVRFDVYQRGRYETGTRIVVEGDSGLTLRPERGDTALEKFLGGHEIEIGDEAFDREVYVRGSPEVARAVLDVETRQCVRRFLLGQSIAPAGRSRMHEDVAVLDGDLRADFRDDWAVDRALALGEALRALLALAGRLARPADPPGRIAKNTADEPEWRVRLENVALLAGSYPRHPATRETLRRACQDEQEEVRLRAALALGGEEGRATLLDIASREWAEDSVAARAVADLGRALPRERALAILGHALRTRRLEAARACLASLGHFGGPEVVAPLAKVLAVEGSTLGAAAAQALGASREATAEAPLLEALGSEWAGVRVAAAKALGRVGSAAAVLPLKEAAGSGLLDGALRRAARQAIAEIQSRLAGASPGQLSLADDDAGRLSLADEDPRGQVSLADEEDTAPRRR